MRWLDPLPSPQPKSPEHISMCYGQAGHGLDCVQPEEQDWHADVQPGVSYETYGQV